MVRKVLKIMFLPVLSIAWLVGWVCFYFEEKKMEESQGTRHISQHGYKD